MWSGIPVDGPAFYSLLCADNAFCAELGRATLASGRLETALKRFLMGNDQHLDLTRKTLGSLIAHAEHKQLLKGMIPALKVLRDQRNYLAHNIHSLLSGFVSETILECSDLLDSDVSTYTDRAWQLADNLNGLAEIVEGKGI